MKKLLTGLVALAALSTTGHALATTGGGATIHNAATMTFGTGQQVTASVDVEVRTIGAAPTITSETVVANAGDSITVNYTITGNSNGSDIYGKHE